MPSHVRRHKELDACLNELVADFIRHSGVDPPKATLHQLLVWSTEQAKGPAHPYSDVHPPKKEKPSA